jgi:hypothetical protein
LSRRRDNLTTSVVTLARAPSRSGGAPGDLSIQGPVPVGRASGDLSMMISRSENTSIMAVTEAVALATAACSCLRCRVAGSPVRAGGPALLPGATEPQPAHPPELGTHAPVAKRAIRHPHLGQDPVRQFRSPGVREGPPARDDILAFTAFRPERRMDRVPSL